TPGNMSASWLYTQAVSLPSVSRKEVTILVFPRRSLSSVTIALTADEENVTSVALPVTCLSEDDALYGVMAASPSVFNILSNLDPINGNASTAQLQLADIPEKSAGLEILDALVISDMDAGALSAGQQQAIADWVVQGGQLIVAGGPGWQKTAAGLGDLLPFTPNSTQT
ncbi:MAG: hypothetical protein GY803_24580, partial [Chloroflexi bacterium]|nr:hypothetical protein [Chloroflexota bacterium]